MEKFYQFLCRNGLTALTLEELIAFGFENFCLIGQGRIKDTKPVDVIDE
jgi:hypothetical protein